MFGGNEASELSRALVLQPSSVVIAALSIIRVKNFQSGIYSNLHSVDALRGLRKICLRYSSATPRAKTKASSSSTLLSPPNYILLPSPSQEMKPNRFAFLLDPPTPPKSQHYVQTSILHSTPLAKGASDLYFFPPREPWSTTPSRPKSIFLFLPGQLVHCFSYPMSADALPSTTWTLPGNPGLLSYYVPFLTTLSLSPTFPPNCAILALAHVGHSPQLEVPELIGLNGVVESELAVVDELLEIVGTEGKLGLCAHSMGCWISVEVSSPSYRIPMNFEGKG